MRNNLATAAAFRRLAVAATVNGTALSLFALLQFFGAPHQTLYWTVPAGVEVFGPFICRNHFPFYVNVCLGLGAGLLLSLGAPATGGAARGGWWARSLSAALNDPRRLWVGAALVLMLAAVAFSLSRGGFVALVGGAALFLVLRFQRSPRFSQLAGAVLLGGAALALLAWFGADRVKTRLATVLDGQAAREDRIPLWSRLLPSVAQFPVFGSGYGTFDYVEPLTRTGGEDAGYRYEHAHNDYLEALLEGGLVRLGLSLLAVALVYWLGVRAFLRGAGGPDGALALGALFGFTTVVLHSFVDFGLHIPAIAVLTTVTAAQLCGAGDRRAALSRGERDKSAEAAPDRWTFRFLGLAPFAGAAVAVGLGIMLAAEGWRAATVQQYREAASRLQAAADPERRERAVAYLEAAAVLAPEYALLHLQLGDAHLKAMRDESNALGQAAQAADAAQAVLSAGAAPSPAAGAAAWRAASAAREDWLASRGKALADAHRVPGLRNLLHARDACPLLADADMQLAQRIGDLERADSRADYLRRAKRLAPDEPDVWYLCGVVELFDGQAPDAWNDWRRCLELSRLRLPEIAAAAASGPDALERLGRVLPDRPDFWLDAADQLYPEPGAAEERRPLVEKAVLLWERSPGPLKASELHGLASAYASLGREDDALAAYQKALDRDPNQAGWRLQFARLLQEQGRLPDARRELSDLLVERPDDAEVRALLESVNHDIAAGK